MRPGQIDGINLLWKQIFLALKKTSVPVLSKLELTKVDANILLALHGEKEKTKVQLAQRLSFDPNSLTRSLDRLIAAELITRIANKADRRFVQLSLTASGNKLVKKYLKLMRGIWGKALNGIDEEEVELLDNILKKMFANLYPARE